MQRVVVLGRGGAGKSTFARELGNTTGLPVIELDQHFWQPGLIPLQHERWREIQQGLAKEQRWIMDGDVGKYDELGVRLQAADTVLVLDFSLLRCLVRALRRSKERMDFQLATDKIFVKVWPGEADPKALPAQLQVQAVLGACGFPAPRVLTELLPLGPGWAAAMEYKRDGVPADVRVPGVRRAMAVGLLQFVRLSEPYRDIEGVPYRLLPERIWPRPHNVLFDFEATAQGARWIDEIARTALAAMRSATSRIVVGHLDWSAKNMRMGPQSIAVVYDWDAVFLDRETFVLGAAAAHFPMTWELEVSGNPDARDVMAFVQEYEEARGTAFTCTELQEVAASATYLRAYTARCEHAGDPGGAGWNGSARQSLKDNGPFRFGCEVRVAHPER